MRISAEVRLYDRLFTVDDPDAAAGEDGDFTQFLNKDSLEVVSDAKLEPSLAEAEARRALPVRPRRLLLHRSAGFEAGQARVQPRGLAEGWVCEEVAEPSGAAAASTFA